MFWQEVDPAKPVYLGDAVYASFDGYHIWLHLNSHDSPRLIALEPKVYAALCDYATQVGMRVARDDL